jgi:hypothetical protein
MLHIPRTPGALVSLVAAALVGWGPWSPAGFAADHERLTGSDSLVSTRTCVDPIQVDVTFDEVLHIYYDRDGNPIRQVFTGKVIVTFTNLPTGETYRPNSSGSRHHHLRTDEVVIRGENAVMFTNEGGVVRPTDESCSAPRAPSFP